jgi:hypothetical protein
MTHNARWVIWRDDDILRTEFVQVKSVSSELGVGAVEPFTTTHKLDEQRDGALDDSLRLGE